jgi:hypothetical protein
MPAMGWPDSLPAGTHFKLKGVEYRFVSVASFIVVDAKPVPLPAYQGSCVPLTVPGTVTTKVVPAGDVELTLRPRRS